jgi:hypothetical protein
MSEKREFDLYWCTEPDGTISPYDSSICENYEKWQPGHKWAEPNAHVIEYSAYEALKEENERLRAINKQFKVYGTTDCANNNNGYTSRNCSGRVTLFIANEKCTGCDPKSYDSLAVKS